MKTRLLLALLLIQIPAGAIERGSSRDDVVAALGEPTGTMQKDGTEILLFPYGTVTLRNGAVVAADISPQHAHEAAARAEKAKAILAEKQAALERQKRLYPEDHVSRINCSYRLKESWDSLPEPIRPSAGAYTYDVYIPRGYHDDDQSFWKCLVLESPALWDSVKERVRREKWIVIILPDAVQPPVGKTLNGNFLAAYDDATTRFRITRDLRFSMGRVPAAVFAVLRPLAGIILQEPDFSGFAKAGFNPDFLQLNRELRAYVMLGNRNRANTQQQGQFIISRIPKHYVGIYDGQSAIMPESLANHALDWMKKEYNLP